MGKLYKFMFFNFPGRAGPAARLTRPRANKKESWYSFPPFLFAHYRLIFLFHPLYFFLSFNSLAWNLPKCFAWNFCCSEGGNREQRRWLNLGSAEKKYETVFRSTSVHVVRGAKNTWTSLLFRKTFRPFTLSLQLCAQLSIFGPLWLSRRLCTRK